MGILKGADYVLCCRAAVEEARQTLLDTRFADVQTLHPVLRRYILGKFLLPSSVEACGLTELCEWSVARAARLEVGKTGLTDRPSSCEGVTTTMQKKILLLMAIQKELGITFQREETAEFETTQDLAGAVLRGLREKGEQYGTVGAGETG